MKVKVFGMTNCAGCETVKAVLAQKGVAYDYYDVMNHLNMDEASKYGVRSVPTVVVETGGVEQFFIGSSKVQIETMLSKIGV
jgi:glutaredoxin